MDESTVRDRAEAHGKATVAGDLRVAGADLTKEAMSQAGDVMKAMPDPLESSEVTSVQTDGAEFVAQIRYAGGGSETMVESRWADRDGTPKIVSLKVL
jgi:hypothetical protein